MSETTTTTDTDDLGDMPPTPAISDGASRWVEALGYVAAEFRITVSSYATRLALEWNNLEDEQQKLSEVARSAGLLMRFADDIPKALGHWRLPLIVEFSNGNVGVVVSRSHEGLAGVIFSGEGGLETPLPLDEVIRDARLVALARPERSVKDVRVDDYIKPVEEKWLRKTVLRDMRPYRHVMLASLISNVLALSSVIFSMQVYDRVIPSQSLPTLYVLYIGVILAIIFDFVMKHTRTHVIDVLGKRADLRVSDRVMGHALRVKNSARPTSTGTFISQIRDLDQIREMMTSTTVTALCDLPFFFLFLVFFSMLAGPLVIVPLFAIVLMVVPAVMAQGKIRAMAKDAMRESSLRNAMLIETVQGIQDIKSLQAENRFQQQWNHVNSVTGEANLKQRELTHTLNTWTANVQQGVFATIIVLGAPMVIAGQMTTGAVVAASILGSRMMSPMGSLAQLLTRLQHARVAAESLDAIMKMPIDHPPKETRIHLPKVSGKFELKSAVFTYGGEGAAPVLTVENMKIDPGERIALIGKNGAGKSTLLQGLSGMLEPAQGQVFLDDLALQQIDPADVRRDISLLLQDSRLFHGTLRDNLLMGAPTAPPDALMSALAMVGAADFVSAQPKGLDYMVLEGGNGLSGGQKQAILLARLIVRKPRVILLDEPTAAMDEATERNFIQRFGRWSLGRGIIVATHRMRVLELCDRVIVVERGQIALDGPKEQVLQTLKGLGTVKPANAPALPSHAPGRPS
jgi:ATP-binding cassette subfamily C protein LapB